MTPGFDNIYVTYMPSYAATAIYHRRIAAPADQAAFLRGAGWADTAAAALAKVQHLTRADATAGR